jgi:hypothetical protein
LYLAVRKSNILLFLILTRYYPDQYSYSILNNSLIDPCSLTLAMALLKRSAVDNTLILGLDLTEAMVSVTINSVKA